MDTTLRAVDPDLGAHGNACRAKAGCAGTAAHNARWTLFILSERRKDARRGLEKKSAELPGGAVWSYRMNAIRVIEQETRPAKAFAAGPAPDYTGRVNFRRPSLAMTVLRRAAGRAGWAVLGAFLAVSLVPAAPAQQTPPAPPAPPENPKTQGYRIKRDVNMVVLPATVVDRDGKFVPGLTAADFRVFEDGVEQKLALCTQQDIPVSMGLVIDNSGSMSDKRPEVNAAALTFVETSNRNDQIFVVNFNEDYYLDQQSDFTNSIPILREALDRIDSRGSTALYDALLASLQHLKKGTRDKKVLLVVTDGEDDASRHNLAFTLQKAQQSNALIYTIGLLDKEDKRMARKAKKALEELAQATGGKAYFPRNLQEVKPVCIEIATDLRNQYLLGYYPSNNRKDGTFRQVRVEVTGHGRGKLSVRTRPGYYASPSASAASD
jgi:Ca-activated chloride channel homolog